MPSTAATLGQLTWDKLLFITGVIILISSFLNNLLISFGIFFIITGLFIGLLKDYRSHLQENPQAQKNPDYLGLSMVGIYLIIVIIIIGYIIYHYFPTK